MRRALFLLTLTLYGFSAMELSHWVRVPQVVMHLIEHHSNWGHHDTATEHGHDGDEGHNPFGHEGNEVCGIGSVISLPVEPCMLTNMIPANMTLRAPSEVTISLSDHSGSKWNPPKLV